jgi:hypothetical protein
VERVLDKNFNVLTMIFASALIVLVIDVQILTNPSIYAAPINAKTIKFSGPINSLQFSYDNASWIVSGRWRMEMLSDSASMAPLQIKSFNASLIMTPTDGSKYERYELSDFKQDAISYDNKSNTATINGKLQISSKTPIETTEAVLKLANKKILAITLDQSKIKDKLGATPVYGIER